MHQQRNGATDRCEFRLRPSAGAATRQRGSLMLETVAAVFVLGAVGSALVSGISTTARSTETIVVQSEVENVARNQLEYMFGLPYQAPPHSYPVLAAPAGYAVTCEAVEHEPGNPHAEVVTVSIKVQGTERLTVSTIRAE